MALFPRGALEGAPATHVLLTRADSPEESARLQRAVVQSTEVGTAYLVNTSVAVSTEASITAANGALWNSVAIGTANTNTNLSAAGLIAMRAAIIREGQ